LTADGSHPLVLKRKTSDGTILQLEKDGSIVGSIGNSGSNLTIGNGDTGLNFAASADVIIPWNTSTNSNTDGNLDLGNSSNRFKDVYLSGGVYLGGTGSANKLDDYEEGTWTPTFVNFGGSMTIHVSRYTKIGRIVTYELAVTIPTTSDGDAFQYTLPFTPIDDFTNAFVGRTNSGLSTLVSGSNSVRHRLRDLSANNRTYAQFSETSLYITGTYYTT